MSGDSMLLVAATAAVAALIAGSSLAAESAKEGTFTGKIKFEGKITQQISVGEGDRYLTFSFVEEGTSSSDPSVKSHCLGVAHDIDGTLERRGFCVDTDKDGDQILWKLTEEPRRDHAPIVSRDEEELVGTGKFAGRSATQELNCAWTVTSDDDSILGWDCEVSGKYKLP